MRTRASISGRVSSCGVDEHRDRMDGARPGPREGAEEVHPATLRETADLHRLLVSSVVDYAIFVLDPVGRILTWNPGAERLKGYRTEEIVGQHFSIFYPADVAASGHPERELEIATREGRYEEEGWRLRKNGERFWASVTITALRAQSGDLVGFAKVTRDLTERKISEEALRQSEERFRLLVQSVQDYGIFMLDPAGHIASWNEGAERIKGYTESEILGKHFSVFYPEEDKAWDKPGMELRVAGEVGRFEDEGWRIRKDGSRFWANVVITALRGASGTLVGFAKVTRDLTDRRAAELQAIDDARRVAEAEAASRAKTEFLATMSHELRTPLNAIGGYVDLLTFGVHGAMTQEQVAALERVRTSQLHLLGLINDLLNYSRVEAGRVSYQSQAVRLADVAAAVAPMAEPQSLARGVEVEWQDADPSVVALADRARVEQILLNLVTNAIKFTEAGGRIDVRHHRLRNEVFLEVEDTGIGIEPEHLEAIFEPFTQLGRSLTSNHEGTGLGLAISRDMARAMGGDLTARSRPGVGSTFVLRLHAST